MYTRSLYRSKINFRSFGASVIALLLAGTAPAFGEGLTVGSDDVFNLNGAMVDLDCGDLTIEGEFNMGAGGTLNNVGSVIIDGGTLNGDSGTFNVSGDWLNTGGTFDGGTSQVTWNTDCSSATINVSGDNDFYNMTVQTTTGREIQFAAGSTQTFAGHLVMNGTTRAVEGGDLLRISSTGGPAFFVVNGTYAIDRVNVSDNHALTPGEWVDFGHPEDFDSIDSGGNSRWFRNAPPGVDSFRIQVSKTYDDNNPNEVQVTLDCNTGLPIMQTHGVAPGNPINFVVTSIDATEEGPNCEVYEEETPGYAPTYAVPSCHEYTGDCEADNTPPDTGCYYTDIHPGEGDSQNFCDITNTLQPSTLTVNKEWLAFEDHPAFFINNATVTVSCSATADGEPDYWIWDLSGNNESRTFDIFPRWQGDTVCSVSENVIEHGVISEGCDDSYAFEPGSPNASCDMTNTFFAEGIPTLSEWGLLIMTLLMMGVGLVAVRRLV